MTDTGRLAIRWRSGSHYIRLDADFGDGSWRIEASAAGGMMPEQVITDRSILQR